MKGPTPKSADLRILCGTRGRRKATSDAGKVRASVPVCPDWLCQDAKTEWKRITKILGELGVLSILDRAALIMYTQSVADFKAAAAIINAEGTMIEVEVFARDSGKLAGKRKIINPAVKLRTDAHARVKAMLAEFGLTPASRSRLSMPDKPNEEKDELQKLIDRASKQHRA